MFTRDDLEDAFGELGRMARAADKMVEIAIYGGSALVLIFPGRVSTKDVDAVFLNDGEWVRAAARSIAEGREPRWPDDWLNDGVKGWLSARDGDDASRTLLRSYPSEVEVGLRVFLATPEYLFAMKCLAMRIGGVEQTQDRTDIELLGAHLGITTADRARDLVSRYYPASRISPKTTYGLEEIFGRSFDMGGGK